MSSQFSTANLRKAPLDNLIHRLSKERKRARMLREGIKLLENNFNTESAEALEKHAAQWGTWITANRKMLSEVNMNINHLDQEIKRRKRQTHEEHLQGKQSWKPVQEQNTGPTKLDFTIVNTKMLERLTSVLERLESV